MAKRRPVSNLLALALLAVLVPGESMHPYQMATVLRRTGKEHDMRIKWGSFYTVVQNLERHGLIEAVGSDREGRRPERTMYALTDTGRAELIDWAGELLSSPEPEQSRFEAALSVMAVLGPDRAIDLLRQRLRVLDERVAAHAEELARAGAQVARLFLIESEYALAMRRAEAEWVRGLLADLAAGTFAGMDDWRHFHRTGEMPGAAKDQWEEIVREGVKPPVRRPS